MANFEALYDDSQMPLRGTKNSAGYDLYSHEDTIVPAQGRVLVKTGVKCWLEPNRYLAVVPRSGLALKQGITVLNTPGTVDSDFYPNEVGVILYNTTNIDFPIHKGDRIAQGVLNISPKGIFNQVEDILTVTGSNRQGGYGSSGQ